jgi:hypothetical protein
MCVTLPYISTSLASILHCVSRRSFIVVLGFEIDVSSTYLNSRTHVVFDTNLAVHPRGSLTIKILPDCTLPASAGSDNTLLVYISGAVAVISTCVGTERAHAVTVAPAALRAKVPRFGSLV